jgi:predicted nucleotidyltransferase
MILRNQVSAGPRRNCKGKPGRQSQRPGRPFPAVCAVDLAVLWYSSAMERPSSALQRRLAEALLPRNEVLEAYLFGSHALGRAQPHSDIDVAVYVDPHGLLASYQYGYTADLTSYLMQRLGTNAIDVVLLNEAPPLVYHRVLRDGHRVLSRDLRATTTREGYALSRYWDYVPALAKIEAARRASRTKAP